MQKEIVLPVYLKYIKISYINLTTACCRYCQLQVSINFWQSHCCKGLKKYIMNQQSKYIRNKSKLIRQEQYKNLIPVIKFNNLNQITQNQQILINNTSTEMLANWIVALSNNMFQNLLQLQIISEQGNSISLQFLNFLNVQKRQNLILNQNHITNIKPLNKLFFTNLKFLSLFQNDFHTQSFSRMKMDTNFRNFLFQDPQSIRFMLPNKQIKINYQDINLLMKIEVLKIDEIKI